MPTSDPHTTRTTGDQEGLVDSVRLNSGKTPNDILTATTLGTYLNLAPVQITLRLLCSSQESSVVFLGNGDECHVYYGDVNRTRGVRDTSAT